MWYLTKDYDMKTKLLMRTLSMSLLAFLDIHAADKSQNILVQPKMSLSTKDGFNIGLQNYWYKYDEEVDGAFFMSNTGKKYGVSLGGTKNIGNNYYLAGDIRYATGDVEYKSASGRGDVDDDLLEGRLIVGSEAIIGNYLLSSYIGAGYRRLDNDLRDLGSGGYRRTSQYLYIPIGITHRFLLNDTSRISTSIEYDYFAWGQQNSYLSDASPIYPDLVNKQKNGYGARLSSAYQQRNWSIGGFFNYWNIGDSEKDYFMVGPLLYSGMEPKNQTKEIGIEIKYHF